MRHKLCHISNDSLIKNWTELLKAFQSHIIWKKLQFMLRIWVLPPWIKLSMTVLLVSSKGLFYIKLYIYKIPKSNKWHFSSGETIIPSSNSNWIYIFWTCQNCVTFQKRILNLKLLILHFLDKNEKSDLFVRIRNWNGCIHRRRKRILNLELRIFFV